MIDCGIIACDEEYSIGKKYKGFKFMFDLSDEFDIRRLNHRPRRPYNTRSGIVNNIDASKHNIYYTVNPINVNVAV
jgi:hypothetical protein